MKPRRLLYIEEEIFSSFVLFDERTRFWFERKVTKRESEQHGEMETLAHAHTVQRRRMDTENHAYCNTKLTSAGFRFLAADEAAWSSSNDAVAAAKRLTRKMVDVKIKSLNFIFAVALFLQIRCEINIMNLSNFLFCFQLLTVSSYVVCFRYSPYSCCKFRPTRWCIFMIQVLLLELEAKKNQPAFLNFVRLFLFFIEAERRLPVQYRILATQIFKFRPTHF